MKGTSRMVILGCFLLTILWLPACTSVKPYQRAQLNDAEMAFGSSKSEKFEINALHYREGSLNFVKGKSSGGCGCN